MIHPCTVNSLLALKGHLNFHQVIRFIISRKKWNRIIAKRFYLFSTVQWSHQSKFNYLLLALNNKAGKGQIPPGIFSQIKTSAICFLQETDFWSLIFMLETNSLLQAQNSNWHLRYCNIMLFIYIFGYHIVARSYTAKAAML